MINFDIFEFWFWLSFTYLLWMPVTLLILRFSIPKILLNTYFKEPHFLFWETVALKQFPGSFTRTIIFLTITAFPKMGTKRKMTNIREVAPKWFVVTSLLTIIPIGCIAILAISLIFGMGISTFLETLP
jgi:hypothetical protein